MTDNVKRECWESMKNKQMRINEVVCPYKGGFPDDEDDWQRKPVKSRASAI